MRIVRTFFFLLFAGLLLMGARAHALVMTFGSGSDISPVSYSEAGITVSTDPFSPNFVKHSAMTRSSVNVRVFILRPAGRECTRPSDRIHGHRGGRESRLNLEGITDSKEV